MKGSIGARGEFIVNLLGKDGKPKMKEMVIKNALLDNFFTRWTTMAAPLGSLTLTSVIVGTGTNPTTLDMTSLQTPLVGKSPSDSYPTATVSGDGQYIIAIREVTATFAVGQVIGDVTEIGYNVGSNTITTTHVRAMVKDINGNPTFIRCTAEDQLVIVYRIYIHIPTAETSGMVTIPIDGVDTQFQLTGRLANLTTFSNYIYGGGTNTVTLRDNAGVFGANMVNSSGGTSGTITNSFLSGSIQGQRRYQITVGINDGNFASGVKIVQFNGFKYEFNPPLLKTADQQIVLVFKQNFTRI